ncbi:MAG: non-homologous end joining protein Ku [Gaiellales bacterium]
MSPKRTPRRDADTESTAVADRPAPRAIWTGSIAFGLVNAPVRMYAAISENDLRFHLVHEKDGGRIGYQRICKTENEPVPNDEIVKAYELESGQEVYLTDQDFEAARAEGDKVITIHSFVPREQIDSIYFERTYYLGPQKGQGAQVYALLAEAMERSGLSAIATYIFHDRENLACLRVRDGVITLEKMFFHDEVRTTDGIAPDAEVDQRQLEMATELIDRYTGDFDPSAYSDSHRDRLLALIEEKAKGGKVRAPAPAAQPEGAPPDLLAALTASLQEARKPKRGRGAAKKAATG